MMLFSGILINVSVRHTVKVPLWFATQQLVAANSTVSNLNQEPDLTSSSAKSKTSNASDKKTDLGPDPKQSHRTITIRNLFEQNDQDGTQSVKKVLPVDLSTIKQENSLKVTSLISKIVKQSKEKVNDNEVNEKYHKNLNSQIYEKKLGFFFDMNEINKITEEDNLSFDSVLKIMSKLAFHKSRVVPVLKLLTEHIVNNNWNINIKQGSDILYNMASLNFYDEALITKIASILISEIPETNKKHSAVIGSILKSIGILRYRNENLIFQLTTWILANWQSTRPVDICSFLVTLTVVGHSPRIDATKFKDFTDNLNDVSWFGAEDWLNIVWALVVLNQANETQVLSVLNNNFIGRLSHNTEISETKKRKFLHMLAAAKLIFKLDTDTFLKENPWVHNVTLGRSKEKQEFVKEIVNSLYVLLPPSGCLKTNVNTEMGFVVDAEFYVNKNCSPILMNQIESNRKKALRLAIVPETYYDFCRGDTQVIRTVPFQCELLKLSGYHIVHVPYTEYKLEQTIIERVKYLKDNIKRTVEKCSP